MRIITTSSIPGRSFGVFFLDGGKYALLIDEAHQLPQRSRDMFSALLEQTVFADLRRQLGARSRNNRALQGERRAVPRFKPLAEGDEADAASPALFCAQAKKWCEAAQDYVFCGGSFESLLRGAMLSAFFFARIAQGYDERTPRALSGKKENAGAASLP